MNRRRTKKGASDSTEMVDTIASICGISAKTADLRSIR